MRWLPAALLLAGCVRFPDPALLPGAYESTNAPARLTFEERGWTLESGQIVKSGVYQISGDRVAFLLTEVNHAAFERYCREEVDVYEWDVEEGMLRFLPVKDECDPIAQAVLTAGPWTEAS